MTFDIIFLFCIIVSLDKLYRIMADDRLPKRAADLREQGRRRRGRPRLRCKERCEEDRRGGRLEEEDKRQS